MNKKWGAVSALALASIVLTGCSQQQWRDLEDKTQTEPDKVRLVTNVDGYPNVVALCIEGAGFVTTTRENSSAALRHIEKWDAPSGWCGDGSAQ